MTEVLPPSGTGTITQLEPNAVPIPAANGQIERKGINSLREFASPEHLKAIAVYLGLDPVRDHRLLFICEDLIRSELPPGWKEFYAPEGRYYYDTGKSEPEFPHGGGILRILWFLVQNIPST